MKAGTASRPFCTDVRTPNGKSRFFLLTRVRERRLKVAVLGHAFPYTPVSTALDDTDLELRHPRDDVRAKVEKVRLARNWCAALAQWLRFRPQYLFASLYRRDPHRPYHDALPEALRSADALIASGSHEFRRASILMCRTASYWISATSSPAVRRASAHAQIGCDRKARAPFASSWRGVVRTSRAYPGQFCRHVDD